MRRATLFLLPALLAGLLLSGCPGSEFVPLPPGSGQGDYAGQFTNDDESQVYGDFEFSIDNNGALSGDGLLQGRKVDLEGILAGDGTLTGFMTDSVTQISGNFDANLISGVLVGDFIMPQNNGDPDLEGLWDANLQP